MLNFNSNQSKEPVFTLEKGKMRKRRLTAKEWRILALLPFALLGVIYISFKLAGELDLRRKVPDRVKPLLNLARMAEPTFVGATALPSSASIAARIPDITPLVSAADVSLSVGGMNEESLAWARLRLDGDRVNPPIPQRFLARDLVVGDVRTGSPVLISGQIINAEDAPMGEDQPAWKRMILAADEGQYVELIAPLLDAEVTLGNRVNIVGRALGFAQLPTATSATASVRLPLLAVRQIQPAILIAKSEHDELREFHRAIPQSLPGDLFAGISDERAILETRAYYHLIGQAIADRQRSPSELPEALRFNSSTTAFAMYRDPEAWRGKRITSVAQVYQVWEDADATRDQPFGAQRVYRILAWTEDLGYWEEIISGEVHKSIKRVLRLVEFVGVGQAVMPEQGDRIQFTGRFLKIRGIPVQPDANRDAANGVQRQSDKAYMAVFVGNDYAKLELSEPVSTAYVWWVIGVLGFFIIAATAFILGVRSDNRKQSAFLGKVKKLREQRHGLLLRARATIATPAAPIVADAPSGDGSPPPPPAAPPAAS